MADQEAKNKAYVIYDLLGDTNGKNYTYYDDHGYIISAS